MKKALHQAKRAAALAEVPIGCVILYEGRIIGRGFNRRKTQHTTLAHAELTAIRQACRVIGDWRLEGCTMYVTLEPCMMCTAAIIQSHIKKVVYCLKSPKYGHLLKEAKNNKIECIQMYDGKYEKTLKDFFIDKR